MKTAGSGLMAVGLLLACASFLMPNTVDAPQTEYLASIGQTITTGTSAVFNYSKGQLQLMVLQFGGALLIAGAVLHGCGAVVDRIGKLSLQPLAEVGGDVPISSSDSEGLGIASRVSSYELAGETDEEREKHRSLMIKLFVGVGVVLAALLAFAVATGSH